MPKVSPDTRFNADEWAFIGEMLRIADGELRSTLTAIYKVYPEANLCERLRVWLAMGEDIRARLRKLE